MSATVPGYNVPVSALPRFYGWADFAELKAAFATPVGFPLASEIVLAAKEEAGYEESAIIYWRRGGELFEVEASHCSCYGFNDAQAYDSFAAAKPISLAYLQKRPPHRSIVKTPGGDVAWDALCEGLL